MQPNDSAALVPFTFRGDALDVVRLADGDVGLPLRRLCEVLGLDDDAQRRRLLRTAETGCRWACTSVMTVQVAGQGREVVVLPRRSIPMWAATVDASRVAPEVRSKLVAYQDEAAEALARAFLDAPAAKGQLPLFADSARGEIPELAIRAIREGDYGAAKVLLGAARQLTGGRQHVVGAASLHRIGERLMVYVRGENAEGRAVAGAWRAITAIRANKSRALAAWRGLVEGGLLHNRGTKHAPAFWAALEAPAGEILQ